MVKKIFSVFSFVLFSVVLSVGVFAASYIQPDEVTVPVDSLVQTFSKLTGLNYPYVACFWSRNGGKPYISVFHSSKPLERVDILNSEDARYNVRLIFGDGAKLYVGNYSAVTGFDSAAYRVSDFSAYGNKYSMYVYRPNSSVAAGDQTSDVPIFGNSGSVYYYTGGVKGDRFFPGTPLLSEVAGELQVGAGETLMTRLGADLSTLVPFGIGLLALLTALPVLLRVLRRFLR